MNPLTMESCSKRFRCCILDSEGGWFKLDEDTQSGLEPNLIMTYNMTVLAIFWIRIKSSSKPTFCFHYSLQLI